MLQLAAAQNEVLQSKEKFKTNEEKAYQLLRQQEVMGEKWRTEYSSSIKYFEKTVLDLNNQVKRLKKE